MNDEMPQWAALGPEGTEQLLSMISDAAFIDRDGRIAAVNAAGAELYGATVESLIGTPTVELVPEQFRTHVGGRAERLRQGIDRERWSEEEILRADGTRCSVAVRSQPVKIGAEPAALVLIRDLSALRRIEGRLARHDVIHRVITDVTVALALTSDDELDERIDDALEAIGEASGVDRAYVTTYSADQRWCSCAYEWVADGIEAQIDYVQSLPLDSFGWSHSRLMAGRVLHVPDLDRLPDEAAGMRESFARYDVRSLLVVPLVVGRGVIGDVGFNVVRRSMVWTEHEIDLLRNVASVIGMSLTRREAARQSREARDAAIQANAAKDVFLARMSHELRTPLNAVLGFTELLMRSSSDDRDRAMLEQVMASGRHLLNLVEDVLDISRIVSGNLMLSMEPVALDEVIAAAVDMAVHAHKGRLPTITVEESAMVVLADRGRLQQVLVNFVSNAIKYNRPDGTVRVEFNRLNAGDPEAGADAARVLVSVHDTGIGLSADMLARLFEPFDRLGRETSDIEGTGIGLTLTRSLIEAMGGTIGAESIEGQGTTFSFDLALVGERHQPVAPAIGRAGARAPLVLHVEDNEVSRFVVRETVERSASRYLEAASADEGFAMAVMHSPELILVDLHLVGSNGHELITRLRSNRMTRDIPVVVTTAHDEMEAARLLGDLDVAAIIPKPMQPNTLADLLALHTAGP